MAGTSKSPIPLLDCRLIRDWHHRLHTVADLNCSRPPRHQRLSLEMHMASFLLRLELLLCVLLNPVQELLSRSRQVDVLDTDVDALLYVAVSHFLVDYDADGSAGDIVYDAGLPVVDFVGHAFLNGPVGFDVDDITNSVEVISSRCRFSKGLEFRTCMV